MINSFSADLINAISKDKIVTPKHYLVGLGIHNITGQKVPVQVMSRLGHSISYSQVCEIETSFAELALHKAENEFEVLPILPESDETVLTYFWVDNFNVKVEKIGGTSAVNTTHLMAFQEKPSIFESSPFNEPLMNIPSFERSSKGKLSKKRDLEVGIMRNWCYRRSA